LADKHGDGNKNNDDIDAKSILTALAIEKINKEKMEVMGRILLQ
jgi:hypothetical protein